MQNKKVAILLSSYNGEKYIKEQIDSILAQTYKNIEIYVRDDGSKDNTINILKEYEEKGQIKLIQGENLGFVNSFFELLKYDDNADYYAFSDQDDVWLPEKIEKQVLAIEKEEELKFDKPIFCYTNYDYYDSELKLQKNRKVTQIKPSFRNSIVECIAMGMNIMINKKTQNKIISNIPKSCYGHDSWAYMVCSEFGSVIEIKEPLVKYRRHLNNVSAGGSNFLKFQCWRIKKFFFNNYFKNIKAQLCEYEKIYKDEMNEKDLKLLRLFTKKFNYINQLKKAFYLKRFRSNLIDEIMIRIIFLIGAL
jgi:rhamnosyltransferase